MQVRGQRTAASDLDAAALGEAKLVKRLEACLHAGDRVRWQLHHAEAVLLRAGKYQLTGQVPAAALGGLRAGAWYASTCVC